jgi:hypothetical protein
MVYLEQYWNQVTWMKNGTNIMDLYLDMISTLDITTGLALITFEIFRIYGPDLALTCYFASWLADVAHIPVVPGWVGSQTLGSNCDDAEPIDHAAGIWDLGHDIGTPTLTILSVPFIPRP